MIVIIKGKIFCIENSIINSYPVTAENSLFNQYLYIVIAYICSEFSQIFCRFLLIKYKYIQKNYTIKGFYVINYRGPKLMKYSIIIEKREKIIRILK